MITAELEITGAIIRLFKDGAFGDPPIAVVLVVGDEGTATLKGFIDERKKTTAEAREAMNAILACLKRAGFKRRRWHRHKNGFRITVDRTL